MKTDTVRLLLKHGADLSVQDKTHSTPLHLAALSGSPETVRLLLEHGADVAVLDGSHKTALHLASSWVSATTAVLNQKHQNNINGQYQYSWRFNSSSLPKAETVRLLIEQDMDVTAEDENLSTPLHLASSSGIPEIARLLIERGADINSRDMYRRTPLNLASSWVSAKATSLLFHHRFDVNPQDDRSMSESKADMVGLLIDHGADVAVQDESHSTPLHLASFWGSVETVRRLIEHGADATAKDKNNQAPLHLALLKVSPLAATFVIQCDLDANGQLDTDIMRYNPSKYDEKADTVRLLIEHGADVNAQDEAYTTPLHLASSLGIFEIVQLLIDHGADVTAQDRMHKTPLHLASSWVGAKPALLSIQHKADLNGQDDGHWEPADSYFHAKANIVKLLIDHGADVTAQDETQSMPLHLASSVGKAETVRLLIEQGADVTAQDGNYRTPLHLASSRVSAETMQLFVLHGLILVDRTSGRKWTCIAKSPIIRLIQCSY